MRARLALFITAGVVGAALGGAAISSALTDPDVRVDAIEANGITRATAGPPPQGTASTSGSDPAGAVRVQQVDALEQLTGTLRAGEDPDDWFVSGVEVDFGPDAWISAAPAFEDYDRDGASEPLLAELRGLEGRNLTLGVRYEIEDDRDDADVFTVGGLAYRDAAGAPAPWQMAPSGTEASREEIAGAATAAVGDGAVTIDVDREADDGWRGWDVEVRAADGREYQVYVELTGAVIDVRPDN